MDEERLNRLLDEIAAMASDALAKANPQAAETLWAMARQRRPSR
jgi:hypothetical protein